MGSCLTKTTKNSPQSPPTPPQLSKNQHFQDRTLVPESDPPPSLPRKSTAIRVRPPPLPSPPPEAAEETVKEVLSETPALKHDKILQRFQNPQKILRLPSFPRIEETHENQNKVEEPEPAVSELSEICSMADSVSTEYYEEALPQPRRTGAIDRSPSKIRRKRTDSGEAYASPVRRSEQWLMGRPGQANEARQWSNGAVVRDQGESSRRRSRSPVTRVDSGRVCRSPSGKRGARSAGRSPVASDARDGKRPVKESLEDPLVSLECFIFL